MAEHPSILVYTEISIDREDGTNVETRKRHDCPVLNDNETMVKKVRMAHNSTMLLTMTTKPWFEPW